MLSHMLDKPMQSPVPAEEAAGRASPHVAEAAGLLGMNLYSSLVQTVA